MVEVIINLLAVLGSAIAMMVIGMVWYGPLFGQQWMALMGLKKQDMDKAKKKGMGPTYIVAFIGTLVMAYVLAHTVDYAEATDFIGGAQAGFWIWLGFIAPVMLGQVLWEGKSTRLYLINASHYLVALVIAGAILATWV
jgi:hypothetical protein